MRPSVRPTAAAVCLLTAAMGALGQDAHHDHDAPAAAEPQSRPRFLYSVGQSIDAASVPHIDGGGKATTALTRSELSLTWLASERTRAILEVSNEFAFYDFDGATRLDPVDGAPFGSFTRQNVDLTVAHAISQRWRVLGFGGLGFARERTADLGDSVVWRAGLGTSYYVTENISLGVSLVAQNDLEGGTEILPIPQIDATFAFDERWTLRLATIGGATLTYQAFDELAFTLKAGYQERQYRLDDEGLAPEGVFQDKSIDLMLGVLWQPVENLEVTAGVGSQLWRRFKIKDEDGNRLSRVEADPTLMLHAGLSFSF